MISLENKNELRRHGSHCAECKKKLSSYRLDGVVNNKSVAFCSCKCCDKYKNKIKEVEKE